MDQFKKNLIKVLALCACLFPLTSFGESNGNTQSPSQQTSVQVPQSMDTTYDLFLLETGKNKIGVIKFIQAITGCSLKDAKELTDNPPKRIKTYSSKDLGPNFKDLAVADLLSLGELGASAELK